MGKLLQTVFKGYLQHPFLGLFYAVVLYVLIGLLLRNFSLGMNGPNDDSMSESGTLLSKLLVISVAMFSLGLSGLAMARK